MSEIKQKAMSLLNRMIPKGNIILFESFPDFSDNSYALYQYIINERLDITKRYKIIWGKKENLKVNTDVVADGTEVIDKKSLKGYWTFLRSKYVFSTHGYFGDVRSGHGQIQVNLWHGCGYKTHNGGDKFYRGDYTIVTSGIYQKLHSEFFDLSLDKVLVTGLPRNDRMYRKANALEKLGIAKTNCNKVVIWLPTYRKAKVGYTKVDGLIDAFGLASISEKEYKGLNEILDRNKILLIIKPHPMDSVEPPKPGNCESIKIINNQDLMNAGIDLYDLLPETDSLLSDYSSVIVDYLQLDKPIALICSDLQEYRNSRGFNFDSVDDYFPGPVISNFIELEDYFINFCDINER